jgi:hypothetical protein
MYVNTHTWKHTYEEEGNFCEHAQAYTYWREKESTVTHTFIHTYVGE